MLRDVVILLPGITGSVLADKMGHDLWAPSADVVWRAITSFGRSVEGLKLPDDGSDGGVTASRLVPDVSIIPGLIKIDGYSKISDYLVSQLGLVEGQNFFPFPYDWRLDNRVNAERLKNSAMDWLRAWRTSSGNADAKLILIGHSMGGLISRYFIECLEGWKDTRRLMTLGTPHRGSLNAVGFLEEGMKKGIGPLGIDLAPLLRSLPSVYQLLPIYPCVSVDGGELQRVTDAAAAGALPHVDVARARDARLFHQQIQDAQAANAKLDAYATHGPSLLPLVGIEQPTWQSAQVRHGVFSMLREYKGSDDGGDGTVPRISGTPIELSDNASEVYAAESHGALQNADSTLANLRGVLTRDKVDYRIFQRAEDAATISLDMEDVVGSGEAVMVRARVSEGNERLQVTFTSPDGTTVDDTLGRDGNTGWQIGEFQLPPGLWRVRVHGEEATPVNDLVVVASP